MGQDLNKGLTTNEKQEGLLKRLKNIEDKTDNQLQATEDQKNDQLALIDEINNSRTKSTGFKNKKLEELEKKFKDKEKKLERIGKVEKKKKIMIITDNYRATDDTSFYFSSYTHLMTFADVYKKSCHLIPQAVVSQKKKKGKCC